jgi:hypothetical protein
MSNSDELAGLKIAGLLTFIIMVASFINDCVTKADFGTSIISWTRGL